MGELLSPVEAILQNILGADNILVPPGSQVEEILQAIYYNTEYEKNPKSRVAEILLAIKNNGVYDGPVLSRVEDILVHKLNNIPYTKHKKEDLSRVEQLLLDWLEQGGGEEIIEYTGTFPMTILANGEPLLDYIISGNTVQSGTPTPDNPIMPQGTGERTGNIMPFASAQTIVINGVTFVSDGMGRYTVNGTATADASVYFDIPEFTIPVSVGAGGQGTFSLFNDSFGDNGRNVIEFYNNTTLIDAWALNLDNKANKTYVSMSGKKCNKIRIVVKSGISIDHKYVKPMFTNDSTLPTAYEPYGYKITISSANTTTPIYLGEVEATRQIQKLVLDGTENWADSGSGFFFTNVNSLDFRNTVSGLLCSHLPVILRDNFNRQPSIFWGRASKGDVCLCVSNAITSLSDFKAYLATQYANGTPVTVWYVLATPTTGIVNEPLMRIGDYADTLSMEQAGADVPTNEKPTETVIDVPTSVKPSEGYIKYTEPTDGPTPKTQVLGTKDHKIYMTSNDEVYVLRR